MVLPFLQRFYVLAIWPELALKAKPIWEPKDLLTEEDSFFRRWKGILLEGMQTILQYFIRFTCNR